MMDGTVEHPIMYFDAEGKGPFSHICERRAKGLLRSLKEARAANRALRAKEGPPSDVPSMVPIENDDDDDDGTIGRVSDWLLRQRYLGKMPADHVEVIERLIEDLR